MLAIHANHVFDGHDFRAGGGTVLVEDGRIAGVEPAAYDYDLPSDGELLDYGEATVLPGLIDPHVHLVADSGLSALDRVAGYSPDEIDTVVTGALRGQLAAGVTTVRDLGDRNFNVVERRDAQRQVDDGLPWIVASGPPITTPGGHCGYLGGEVSGADEIAAAVRERVERDVDVVKVMASGGLNTADTDVFAPPFSIDDLRLLVEQVHAAGLPVTAHAHAALAVDQAVAVGVQGIEHASYLVRPTAETGPQELASLTDIYATGEQLAALAASVIAVCLTLGGFNAMSVNAPPQVKQLLADAGVTADAGIAPHKAHGRYAEAVIELSEVAGTVPSLIADTSGAAATIGLGKSKGCLRRRYDADILVVGGELAADVNALRDVRQVVLRGTPVPPRLERRTTHHAGVTADETLGSSGR